MKDKQKITRLAVMDFDGTLVTSPMPDTGKVIYEEKTGNKWPHRGWWGRTESLDMGFFDIETKEEVIADYHKETAREDTLVIMLTGRMTPLAPMVEKVLDFHKLRFDGLYYNTGGETCYVKLKTLDRLLKEYPQIKEVHFWEDRALHIPKFEAWGQSHPELDVKITFVEGGQHD